MNSLEGLFLRPRQVRYQAALRPDMTSRIDSKVLPNFVPARNLILGLDRVKTVPLSRSLHGDRAR